MSRNNGRLFDCVVHDFQCGSKFQPTITTELATAKNELQDIKTIEEYQKWISKWFGELGGENK